MGKDVVSVGAADAGREIELKVGQLLLVQLPASSTSGRTWQMLREPAQLVLMPDEKRFDQTPEERAQHESVGLEQLRFRAVGPGETIVSLAMVRPGAGLAASDERWMLQVIVVP